jgi:16S rRNA pseudouridine516 synthase
MESKRARLDRFISSKTGMSRRDVRPILARGEITIDGNKATDINQLVDEFTHVTLNNKLIQSKRPRYIMMNKPTGVVSATKDNTHQTVVDLLKRKESTGLHIVGRLDFNTSGLLLLTNDGRWSRRLSSPESKIAKLYRVVLEKPMTTDYVKTFAKGMYFNYEGITTKPAKLEIIDEYTAKISLIEGRYHQIKRMFGRFQNRVVKLHRLAVGNLSLDQKLTSGEYRVLTEVEVKTITKGVSS